MSIEQDLQKSSAPGYVELFILNVSSIPALSLTEPYYFTNSSRLPIIWNSKTFIFWPMKLEGFEQISDGAPPRPTLVAANTDSSKLLGSLVFAYSDIVGAELTYIRTFEPYLGGSGSISKIPFKYTIGKKVLHNAEVISFELRSAQDKENSYLPGRQMLKKDFPGLGLNKYFR